MHLYNNSSKTQEQQKNMQIYVVMAHLGVARPQHKGDLSSSAATSHNW